MSALLAPLTAAMTGHGLLLASSVLHSPWFGVLAAFVAVNTLVYVALAVAKTLPKVHVRDRLPRRYQRSETRSIHPDAPV